jgi:hypothetical protein
MERKALRCDWRGSADCARPAEVQLVHLPSPTTVPRPQRPLCQLHAKVVANFCARAGIPAPLVVPLAVSVLQAGRLLTA